MAKATTKKATANKKAVTPEPLSEPVIQSIKAFDADFSCRGYKFEIGKTYEVSGRIEACANGFHACPESEHPFSVFEYYPPSSRFALVSQAGATHVHGNKLASAKITINAEVSFGDLTKRAIEWVLSRIDKTIPQTATNTGYRSAATNTGDRSAATNTGDRSAATNTGDQSAATNTGYQSAATNTGDLSAATNAGDQSAAEVSGLHSAALASGYEGKVKGALTNALFAVERNKNYKIISVACGIVGRDGIEPNVWYACKNSKLVKV